MYSFPRAFGESFRREICANVQRTETEEIRLWSEAGGLRWSVQFTVPEELEREARKQGSKEERIKVGI